MVLLGLWAKRGSERRAKRLRGEPLDCIFRSSVRRATSSKMYDLPTQRNHEFGFAVGMQNWRFTRLLFVVQVDGVEGCPPNWSIIQRLQEPALASLEQKSLQSDPAVEEIHECEPSESVPTTTATRPECIGYTGDYSTVPDSTAPSSYQQQELKSASGGVPASSTRAVQQGATDTVPTEQPCSWAAARIARQAQQKVS